MGAGGDGGEGGGAEAGERAVGDFNCGADGESVVLMSVVLLGGL